MRYRFKGKDMDWIDEQAETTYNKLEAMQASVARMDTADTLEFAKQIAKALVIGVLEVGKQLALGNTGEGDDE